MRGYHQLINVEKYLVLPLVDSMCSTVEEENTRGTAGNLRGNACREDEVPAPEL